MSLPSNSWELYLNVSSTPHALPWRKKGRKTEEGGLLGAIHTYMNAQKLNYFNKMLSEVLFTSPAHTHILHFQVFGTLYGRHSELEHILIYGARHKPGWILQVCLSC